MNSIVSVILFLIASTSSCVWAQSLSIEEVQYSGTGCPQGSVSIELAPDASSFTVLYDRFDLRVGAESTEGMMDCLIRVRLKKPRQMGFRIESADFRGFVQLDPGVVGVQKIRLTSGTVGASRKALAEFGYEKWKGPINENFVISALGPVEPPEVVDCAPARERSVIVLDSKIRIRKAGGSRVGQITIDSVDGRLTQKYNLRWTDCTGR